MAKTFIGIIRDHSMSMRSNAKIAMLDYNSKIDSIKSSIVESTKDTFVTTIELGYNRGGENRIVGYNVPIGIHKHIDDYPTNGGSTPLWDAVGMMIKTFEDMPDANDPSAAFLVTVVTDGDENSSNQYTSKMISDKIKSLQTTDRWSFAFRVPAGSKRSFLSRIDVYPGNVEEWEVTERGALLGAKKDADAFTGYMTARSLGATSIGGRFYAQVTPTAMAAAAPTMDRFYPSVVETVAYSAPVRDYVEKHMQRTFVIGTVFYELTKTEEVQPNKKIVIKNKKTGEYFTGQGARDLFGLPQNGYCRLSPASNPEYVVFVQSTSVNRLLKQGTVLLIS